MHFIRPHREFGLEHGAVGRGGGVGPRSPAGEPPLLRAPPAHPSSVKSGRPSHGVTGGGVPRGGRGGRRALLLMPPPRGVAGAAGAARTAASAGQSVSVRSRRSRPEERELAAIGRAGPERGGAPKARHR